MRRVSNDPESIYRRTNIMYEPLKKSQKENPMNLIQNQENTLIKKKSNPTHSLDLSHDVRLYYNLQKNKTLDESSHPKRFQTNMNQEQAEHQSDNIVQLYTANEQTYQGEDIQWDNDAEKNDFWATVAAGFQIAKQHLENTIQAWIDEGTPNAPLAQYSQRVLNVLNSDELQIYPMLIAHTYGLSGYNEYAISLNINLLNKKNEQMAKTLIHEAFHIIGGCWIVDPVTGNHTPKAETRSISTNVNYLYRQLNGAALEDINADTFAQYVMQW